MSFNGATHSRAWKRPSKQSCTVLSSGLQWSHALTRVETAGSPARDSKKGRASMEPRTHARGNSPRQFVVNEDDSASMEPRTHARGNRRAGQNAGTQNGCFYGATHSHAWEPI